MQCNLGKMDRELRTALGLAIIGAGLYEHSWWGLIGLIPLVSAKTGFCMAYSIFGISTNCCATDKSCSVNKSESDGK